MSKKVEDQLFDLKEAFLNLGCTLKTETHEVEGLGPICLKELSVGLRDEWGNIDKDNSLVWLIQNTVCNEAGEFVLKDVEPKRLKNMPVKVFEKIVDLIFAQNGFRVASSQVEPGQEELKNLETSQT